jgi:Cdc6-like AAA superfamily ATPase
MKETAKMYLTSDELEKLDTLKILISDNQPVMIYGETGELYSFHCTRPCYISKYLGRGKTLLLKELICSLKKSNSRTETHLITAPVHGPTRESFQEHLTQKLHQRSTTSIGAPHGKNTNFFVDDFHHCRKSHMELVRLMCDHKAIYDDTFNWIQVEDVGFVLSAESEFKSKLSPRLSRHFCNFHMLTATDADLLNIYRVRL